jgi:hypothetical protein
MKTYSNLDNLWRDVIHYRSSKQFKAVLEACSQLRHIAPYNAMLVEMQRPGARYVLTKKEWEKRYNRVLKENARPLVILFPFGPVEFVFDIADTMQNEENRLPIGLSNNEILDEIARPFKTKNNVSDDILNTLIDNLAVNGIALDTNMIAGAGYGANVKLLVNKLTNIMVPINNFKTIQWDAGYLLSVNKNADKGELFSAICHELGHLFCHHLPMPIDWKEKKWDVRWLDHKWQEFEAESVAWLVCERLGIYNPSEKYLATYLSQGDSEAYIDKNVSLENILTATNEIEKLLKPLDFRKGLLYKHCENFKKFYKLANLKRS